MGYFDEYERFTIHYDKNKLNNSSNINRKDRKIYVESPFKLEGKTTETKEIVAMK